MKKGFVPIIVIIVLAAIVFLGYTIYYTIGLFDPCKSPIGCGGPKLYESPQSSTAPVPDETANPDLIGANWKTYTFEEVGLSFKYPEDKLFLEYPEGCFRTGGKLWARFKLQKPDLSWYSSEDVKNCNIPGEDGTQFQVSIEPKEININTLSQSEKSTKIQLAGQEANLIYNRGTFGGEGGSVIKFNRNGKGFWIYIPAESSGPGSKIDPLFNQILSTFKFTSDETANWKTYTNNQANFLLKYPPDWTITQKPKMDIQEDGITLRGKEGLIEIGWATQFGAGGCEQNYSLSLKDQTVKSCHGVNSDGTEWWRLFGWRGSNVFPIVYGDATAHSPYKDNREVILKIFSTIQTSQ